MYHKHIVVLAVGFGIGLLLGSSTHVEAFSKNSFQALALRSDVLATLSDLEELEEEEIAKEVSEASTTPAIVTESAPARNVNALKIPVVVYHSVRPYIEGESYYQDIYDVTPELLESELAYLAKEGFSTVSFSDVEAYWSLGRALPPKPVILTFDDGWRNEYLYAFPLLKKYGMKGTFFIYTNPINNRKPHWVSWDEVVEMDKAGMEIGGHSFTHPELTKIMSDDELRREIEGGKAEIERHLGHKIDAFAYPFGMRNAHVEDMVRMAGYRFARSLVHDDTWNDPAHRLDFHGALSTDRLSDFIALVNKP